MGSVIRNTWRHTIAVRPGRCADDHLGCPCKGNPTIHTERTQEISDARANSSDSVTCPECGDDTAPLRLVTWGHCRSCHTADSRAVRPLRW